MGHGHSHTAEIKNPGTHDVSSTWKMAFMAFAVIGLLSFVWLLFKEPERAWSNFVMNHFYFMSLAIGGLFFAAIQWLTGAMWSAPVRRIAESFTAYLPIALLTLIVLFFGVHTLYHWSHPEAVKGDMILEGKSGYLNMAFFVVRNLVIMGAWIFFAYKMIGNSLKQDQTKDYGLTMKNRFFAPIFLILFAISYTVMSFDQVMSLDPHWFSTIFGVYCFAGLFYTTLTLTTLIAITLVKSGKLSDLINENHIHDLGKFMFAFVVFWAYIGFSQFMLIWYANLPEETGYYLKRMSNGWLAVSVFLLVGKFFIPFFALLPRGRKRSLNYLFGVGCWMLFMNWVDMMWMVQPEFYPNGPKLGIFEITITLGFIGLFGLAVSRFFAKNNIAAIGDPRLPEALHHHQ